MRTKKEMLWDRLCALKLFSSIKVYQLGSELFLKSAQRRVQEWREEGRLRALTNEEKEARGLLKNTSSRFAWYEVV